jgi:multiple sugar transport system substrate-binding protein
MSTSPFTRRRFLAGTLTLSSGLALAACGGGGGSNQPAPAAQKASKSDIDEAMNRDTQLTIWTWVPNIQNEIDLFEKKYPKVKVKLVNVGQGSPHYQKLRAAIQSGKGAPDVAQMEFQYLPSFTLGDNLLDMAPNGAAEVKSQYPDWVWSQVIKGEAVYGIPQDIGPMGLLYRDDLLKAAGVQPPTTWDEYATAAETYHSKNPKSYLTNLAPNEAGQILAWIWQLGGRPFSFDGKKTVKLDLAGEQGKKVAQYWNGLVSAGTVSVDPDFTDAWYQGLSNGKYASWLAAAWGPVFLQGTAKKTSGKWRATALPQWDPSKPAAGNWGGSTDAVLKSSKNPIAATQLALFINTDHESALKLATEQFLFPASNEILKDPKFAEQAAPFYGGQKVNAEFTKISATVTPDFGWPPFYDFVNSNFADTMGKAIADKKDLVAGLQAWQDACVKYAKDQGFTVS